MEEIQQPEGEVQTILHVIDSAGLYGAEMMVITLMREQKAMGMVPILMSLGGSGSPEKMIERTANEYGLNVIKVRLTSGLMVFSGFKIIRLAKSFSSNVIHSHGYKPDILLGLLPKWLRKIPVVTTLHGWTDTGKFNKLAIYATVHRLLLRNLDQIAAVSQSVLQRKTVPDNVRRRAVVISNGIKEERPVKCEGHEHLREEINKICRYGTQPVLGTIGRLSEEKGHRVFLEAVCNMKRRGVEAGVVLIGDGPLHSSLVKYAHECGLGSDVYFAGYQKDAARFLRLIDYFVLPSFTEGMPITILEAMREGVPIIASAVGAIPKLLGDNEFGYLVKPQDVEALSRTIQCALEEPEISLRKAEKGKKQFRKEYTSRAMATQYREFYSFGAKNILGST